MDEKSAKNLLKKTFKNEFNLDNYIDFLTELFGKINIDVKDQFAYLKKGVKKDANKFLVLGSYRDSIGDLIDLYVIELTRESSIDKARTLQRNLVASYMKSHNKNAALVAFYNEDLEDWRFSYVKLSYQFTADGLKEKLSSPKRHSFLVGPNEPNHTCETQFLKILKQKRKLKLTDLDEAFDIENVTDEFFKKYNELYLMLKKSLEKVVDSDETVASEFESKHIDAGDFSKKLMGQLVFVYFLQKKGWLGLKPGDICGTGPKNFLRKLFNKEYLDYDNFFNDILEPLFYSGFSEYVNDNHYSQFGFEVPFLNGGLFEPINDYSWNTTDIVLDNDIFSKIFDTFDKFNFTIKEDEPLEKEVAVDPEMLGKVFENLMEVISRKKMGAFYTPRYIVHYICKETLISYLCDNSNVEKEDIIDFIHNGEQALESIIHANDEKKKYNGKQYTKIQLPNSIKENSAQLDSLLKNVKIVDPAVGSGAFPVGMMNEIVRARQILLLLNDIVNIDIYELKKQTIESSLYGVDLEYSSTDVTKLRFWLSLIVDEDVENINDIQPLPNLDNHIVCGNSLVDEYDDVKLFNSKLIKERFGDETGQTTLVIKQSEVVFENLEKKKSKLFEATTSEKSKLRNEITELKWGFIESFIKEQNRDDKLNEILNFKNEESKPFLIWELEFSEVFKGKNPGFDIVIGNPPYGAKLSKKEQEYLNEKYIEGGSETAISFIKLSYDRLLKDNGKLGFIIPKSFTYASNYNPIREYVFDYIETVIDCGKVWKNVKLEQVIFTLNKNRVLSYYNSGTRNGESLPIDYKVKKDYYDEFKLILNGVNDDEVNLARHVKKSNKFLNDIIINIRGGALQNKMSDDGDISLLGGAEIQRNGIIGVKGKINSSEIKNKEKVMINENAILVQNLIAHITRPKDHIKITACIPNSINFGIVDSVNQIIVNSNEEKYIVWALLNSKLINWYCYRFIYAKAIRTMHFDNPVTSRIPLPTSEFNNNFVKDASELCDSYMSLINIKEDFYNILNKEYSIFNINNKIKQFENLTFEKFCKEFSKTHPNLSNNSILKNEFKKYKDQCLKLNDTISFLEDKLNDNIYKIYGLNDDEIKIIEEF